MTVTPRLNAPKADEILVRAATQEVEGTQRRLRGNATIETTEMLLKADEIDYDPKTGYAEARGNVKFDYFADGTHIEADRVEYELSTETGKYYNVRGSSPGKIEARPYILTTTNPFSFQGKWAERIENRYILHEGFVTNCKLPNPWWVLRGREFDVIPGDRAIARNSTFWLRKVPLFYTPRFYKALSRAPRKSGFLQSHFGNSSRRGQMIDASYYWAINRSYDTTYRAQLFTTRGFAHNVDFRGKPTATSDFNYILYGVQDRGRPNDQGGRDAPQSGTLMSFNGRAELPKGFIGRAHVNYLSSFAFRREFTESFYEAIATEVQSVGTISKHWSSFGLNFVGTRIENFSSVEANDKVSLRRLPSVEFTSRDREINTRVLPVWISFDASGSLLRRNQLAYRTANFVDRIDFEPRISSALRWKDVHLIPSVSLRETHYGASLDDNGRVSGSNVLRSTREFSADLILPSISKIFASPPSWIGTKLKHVIEPRATYRYVNGVNDFRRTIRFDENDLLANTNEVEFSVTNRFFAKRQGDQVNEVLTWHVAQRRFFDPTFGGALVPGRRNVLFASASLTGFTFLDGPRDYSPVVSSLRASPASGLGFEWRADYDPMRTRFVNSGLTIDTRFFDDFFVSVGHNQVRSDPVLTTSVNQLSGMFGFGQETRKGWSTRFLLNYDYKQAVLPWAQAQITYNTDCCGWSVQYRRLEIGIRNEFGSRNENQIRFAFTVANIGSFGTLRKQERMF